MDNANVGKISDPCRVAIIGSSFLFSIIINMRYAGNKYSNYILTFTVMINYAGGEDRCAKREVNYYDYSVTKVIFGMEVELW